MNRAEKGKAIKHGSGSRRRSSRKSRHENVPVDCFADECAAEYMDRRAQSKKGKSVAAGHAEDIVLVADTESDDDDYGENSGEEGDHITYKQAIQLFRKIKISGTRYAHQETMEALGIADDVEYMLHTCGLTTVVTNSEPSYKEETCQFLASVEWNLYDEHMVDMRREGGFGYITFLARGHSGKLEKFGFTVKQFEELFQLPPGRATKYEFDNSEIHALWDITAGPGEYLTSRAKSNQLRNPAIRYFHRAVANACFPRMLTGNVRQAEIEMIDEGLKELLNRNYARYGRRFRGDLPQVRFTSQLLEQLLSYRSWASKLKDVTKGRICVGGIVTAILKACDVQFTSKPIPPTYMDIAYLKRIGFLEKTSKVGLNLYVFTNPETDAEDKMVLPNPEFTDLRISGNIDFKPPNHALWTVQPMVSVPAEPTPANEPTDQEPECYYMEDDINVRWSAGVKSAHKKSSMLQKWNKFQDGVINKLVKTTREMSGQIKDLKRALKSKSHSKESSSHTEQLQPQPPMLRRTRSVSHAPRRRSISSATPARTSSYVPGTSQQHDYVDTPQVSANFIPNSTTRLDGQLELGRTSHRYNTEHDRVQQINPLGDLHLEEGEAESARDQLHSVAYNDQPQGELPPPNLDFDPYAPTYQIGQPYTDNAGPTPWNLYF